MIESTASIAGQERTYDGDRFMQEIVTQERVLYARLD
jgi:hypothetical protein